MARRQGDAGPSRGDGSESGAGGGDEAAPLGRDELLAVLDELLEAERAGVKAAAVFRDEAARESERTLLDAVHADEARSCALLVGAIRRLEGAPSPRTGGFLERALAVEGSAERLGFLNRGQRWVVRRLEATIPRVSDAAVAGALREMLEIHRRNVSSCEALLAAGSGRLSSG